MPRKAKGESAKSVGYQPFTDIRFMEVTINGIDPLIVHAWSQKAVMEILGKEMKIPKNAGGREERDPEGDFESAKYYDHDGFEAFPAVALKKAMVSAVPKKDDLTKVGMRQAFFTWGVEDKERARILDEQGAPQAGQLRGDMVRLGGQSNPPDIRFRPDYQSWQARIIVEYNAFAVSKGQLINLMGLAGYGVGIMEWRPERNGTYGRFEIVDVQDLPKRPVWKKATSYLRKGEMDIPTILAALRSKKAMAVQEALKKIKKGKKGLVAVTEAMAETAEAAE